MKDEPMHVAERLRVRRLALEAVADAIFDECWRGLDVLSLRVRGALVGACAPSGRWRDLYAQAPYRLLDVPVLLLEDLRLPDGDGDGQERADLEQKLAEATLLLATAVVTSELLAFGEVAFGPDHVVLLPSIVSAAEGRLALASAHAADRQEVARISCAGFRDHALSLKGVATTRVALVPTLADDHADSVSSGKRFAPLRAPVACALLRAGRADLLAPLLPLLDEAHALFQLTREISELTRDLARGHCTIPIGRLLGALDVVASDGPPPEGAVRAAILLTRSLPELASEGLRRQEALESGLEGLGLAHLRDAVRPLREPFAALRDTYVSSGSSSRSTKAPPARPLERLPRAVVAAKAMLCADPTHREAWEEYRCDLFDEPLLEARAFPIGFVLEQRALAGDDVTAEVDDVLARYEHNRFHYFDQPTSSLCPDADTLGLMLRLVEHGGAKGRWRAALETPLGWVERNAGDDGLIPVFFTHDAGDGRAYAPSILPGACSGVQASLLLGLVSFDADRFRPFVERAAGRLFDDFAVSGGGLTYYTAQTGAWLLLALEERLRRHGAFSSIASRGGAAAERAVARLVSLALRGGLSAQDVAQLSLASAHDAAYALRSPAWLELLLRAQRPDGSFEAAPLYAIPSREGLTDWYASRTATTAIAYRALVGMTAPGAVQRR